MVDRVPCSLVFIGDDGGSVRLCDHGWDLLPICDCDDCKRIFAEGDKKP